MAKLSIIIPSRDEKFLIPTIDDIFRNARADDTEVIAVIDSDTWPNDWKAVTDRYPRLHTIFHGQSKGMRAAINSGAASAISRGAKFIAKFDAHCSFSEGFDEVLKSECDDDWIVVPRRGRLDPIAWTATETHKPDIDYHYLSFPDDPNDFGGPGLNGKPWAERAVERKDIMVDDEMSSQGSGWFMRADYFTRLELMDKTNYGPFWNEFQELGLKCWLSGGQVKVNKKCKYLHLHKGKTHGRGYHLPESWLKQGRNHVMLWPWNEAWPKQTKPFSWLIEHFWPVPSWPENWEEILYASRKPRMVDVVSNRDGSNITIDSRQDIPDVSLRIHQAHYGIGSLEDIDVRERLQNLAFLNKDSLDIIVNNSTLTPGQNPFRGQKKQLNVTYSIDGGDVVTRMVQEKDWLIIGPAIREREEFKSALDAGYASASLLADKSEVGCELVRAGVQIYTDSFNSGSKSAVNTSLTAPALNDYLIRKFSISPQRLRGPMPIELRDFHRNDLAQLFAELGFNYGAEVGVAEANFSEALMKANPTMKLLLVDPWHHYSDNPQGKSKQKHEYAFNEAKRKMADYHNVEFIPKLSMDAVREIDDGSLDMVYLDANHSYPFIMEDLINWTRKVRSGGIVALDDIYKLDEARWGAGPMEAIYDYSRAMRINPWWLIAAHKSVDAFFVKP